MSGFVTAQLLAGETRTTVFPAWYAARREAARAEVAAVGLPTPRDEAWKYTPLKTLAARALPVGDAAHAGREVAVPAMLAGGDGDRVVLVNGRWRADLSRITAQPGVRIEPLAQALASGDEALRDLLTAPRRGRAMSFAELNTLLAEDGIVVRVDAGVAPVRPLEVLCLGTPADGDLAWYARVVVVLEAGAHLQLVERHEAAGAHGHVGNLVQQWQLAAGAQLDHVRVQDDGARATLYTRYEAALAADARVASTVLEIGAQLSRVEVAVDLGGVGAAYTLRGVDAARERQHHDVHVALDHRAGGASSETVWRGIADGRARVVFDGRIVVHAGADGSDAQLSNKNLLLSPHAEIDTRPVLEIHADEVKASHGATVGQLDERALFYLRSRGIPADEARAMLTYAFGHAVLAAVPDATLAAALTARLAAHLPRREIEATA
jgi:Fe-S cluster assembly protein SufD